MKICIGCDATSDESIVLFDDDGFEVCPACHIILRGELRVGLEQFEDYLQHWAEYREWEKAHPVAARISFYTREDR